MAHGPRLLALDGVAPAGREWPGFFAAKLKLVFGLAACLSEAHPLLVGASPAKAESPALWPHPLAGLSRTRLGERRGNRCSVETILPATRRRNIGPGCASSPQALSQLLP